MNLPVRRRSAAVPRTPRAVPIAGTGQNLVPGSNGIPVLTVKIVSYGGQTQEVAHQQVWWDWSRRYPGALVQVVEGDDWEALR